MEELPKAFEASGFSEALIVKKMEQAELQRFSLVQTLAVTEQRHRRLMEWQTVLTQLETLARNYRDEKGSL